MSIRSRITNAELLYKNGHKEGALLLILVAIAATSRKRYPKRKKKDREAFISFLGEELTRSIRVGKFSVKFRNKIITVQELFYEFVRCELAHEARIPEDIKFIESDTLQVSVDENEIVFSEKWIDVLYKIAVTAEENKHEFQDVLKMKSRS